MKLSTLRSLALLACAAPLMAQAAGTAVIHSLADHTEERQGQVGGAAMAQMAQEDEWAGDTTVQWLDEGTMRMSFGSAEEDGYMLVRDGQTYNVMREGGEWMVLEVGDMMKGLVAAIQEDEPELQTGSVKLKKAGGSETVAGIKGDRYTVTMVDGNGKEETGELVLTSDPLVTEFTRAQTSFVQIEGSEKLFDAMPKGQRGILRWDGNFELVSISSDAPDASLFELPAEPQSMADMMRQLMQQRE